MKVIKHGKKNFVAVCARCGCKFSYTINELKAQYPLKYIRCPECGDEYYHPSQDNSQATFIYDKAPAPLFEDYSKTVLPSYIPPTITTGGPWPPALSSSTIWCKEDK